MTKAAQNLWDYHYYPNISSAIRRGMREVRVQPNESLSILSFIFVKLKVDSKFKVKKSRTYIAYLKQWIPEVMKSSL